MNSQEYIKSDFERSCALLVVLLGLLVFSPHSGAITIDSSFVKEISYDYQLILDQARPDCTGTLNITLSVTVEAKNLVFLRTAPHISSEKPFFSVKTPFPANTTSISMPDIKWGTYFRIAVVHTDGGWTYSPTYYTNDYISEEDMEKLMQYSSLANISIDSCHLIAKDGHLWVNNPDITYIEVFDILGRLIFSGAAAPDISLENVNSSFIIARYLLSDKFITSKIFIR